MNPVIKKLLPTDLVQAAHYLRFTKVNRLFWVVSVLLSTLVALFSLYLGTLLFPLIRGIIAHDFSHVKNLFFPHLFMSRFPSFFEGPSAALTLFVVWIYVVTVLRSLLGYAFSLLVRYEALRASQRMRITVIDRYLYFGKLFFDRNDVSSLVWQATNCGRWIEGLFLGAQALLSQALELLVYFSIMVVVSWKLALSALFAVPLFRSVRAVLKNIHKASSHYGKSLTDLHRRLTEMLSFLTLIRSSGQVSQEREKLIKLSSEEMSIALRIHRMTALVDPVQEISGTTAFLFIALFLSWFIPPSQIEATKIFVFFFLMFRATSLMNAIGRTRTAIARDAAMATSLDMVMLDNDKYIVPSGSRPFVGNIDAIEIRNLSFTYTEPLWALHNVNISIHRGDSVGLVGPTGSGKTTLAHLLLRFYDCPAGTIFINGTDIREFETESLRRHMALVSQDAPVLNDTIRVNLLYSTSSQPSEEKLNEVLEKACLTEFVNALPQKLDTVVGERGVMLSGGQRQRIAIARALLKEASFLVLDEPTSALDPENERLITKATHEIMRERTVLIIAHRMSTLRESTAIVFLEKGQVVQQGSFGNLMNDPGPFKQFVEAQRLPDSL